MLYNNNNNNIDNIASQGMLMPSIKRIMGHVEDFQSSILSN